MQIFKANFQPDGRKMRKNFISKIFLKRLKKIWFLSHTVQKRVDIDFETCEHEGGMGGTVGMRIDP